MMDLQNLTWQMAVSIAFLSAIGLTGAIALAVWHRDTSNGFDLRQALVDSVTGKVSIEKVGFVTVLCTMSWALVHMTLMDKLTEWYVLAYTGPFALMRGVSQGLSVFKDIKKDPANAANP